MSAGLPFSSWAPGAALAGWRELRYGNFIFPLTAQEKSRNLKLGQDRKKIPGGWGDFIAIESSVTGREIEVVAAVGSGIIGSNGTSLIDQSDLQAERALLAGLQARGRQQLFVDPDKFLLAYLTEFDFAFFQDFGSFRYADWTLKFVADDPRYYAVTPTTQSLGPFTDTTLHTSAVSQNGNVRAYPTITITGACTSPTVGISQVGGDGISTTFSQLTMFAGDVLTLVCDPRPEYRDQAATYTPSGGAPVNALQYCLLTDFVNTLNVEEWFPYIEVSSLLDGAVSTFSVQSTVAGNYTVALSWSDTWL